MTKYKEYQTQRLIIRPSSTEDARLFLELFNTPKWIKYIGDRNLKTLEEVTNYIFKVMKPQTTVLGASNLTILRKEDNKKIGTCGLYNRNGIKGLDIGYALLPKYEGNGYALEAVSKILEVAFTDFKINEISAITTKDNISSHKLLAKLRLNLISTVTLPNETEELLLFKIDKEKYDKLTGAS